MFDFVLYFLASHIIAFYLGYALREFLLNRTVKKELSFGERYAMSKLVTKKKKTKKPVQ